MRYHIAVFSAALASLLAVGVPVQAQRGMPRAVPRVVTPPRPIMDRGMGAQVMFVSPRTMTPVRPLSALTPGQQLFVSTLGVQRMNMQRARHLEHSVLANERAAIAAFTSPYISPFSPYAMPYANSSMYMSSYGMSYPIGGGYGAGSGGGYGSGSGGGGGYGSSPQVGMGYNPAAYAGTTYASYAAKPSAKAEVSIYDDSFEPDELTIKAGTTVRWTNHAKQIHTVTSNGGLWPSAHLTSAANYSYQFSTPGIYFYRDAMHPDKMRGVVIVE